MIQRGIFFSLLVLLVNFSPYAQTRNTPPIIQHVEYKASALPDRILLSITDNPATTATITWRTINENRMASAEIAMADPSPEFDEYSIEKEAENAIVEASYGSVAYHSVAFTELKPATRYLYRVKNDEFTSEWFQFKTAPEKADSFGFIFMGDAQNKLFTHWSRVIRAAYATMPEAAFILHVGDLINHADNDYEWEEWFQAGGFIHASIPVFAAMGNHEYNKDENGKKVSFSKFWNPQFNFPKNGSGNFEDQVYYLDYLNMRMIVLNSNEGIEEQAKWLEDVLEENEKEWVIACFHHPAISAAKGRQNDGIMNYWKPLLEKYKVDLVLQGHDHTYARGRLNPNENSPTIYVVSVSGEKMYSLSKQDWMDRKAENTQLYQTITISSNSLKYKAYMPDGVIYDQFIIEKDNDGNNTLVSPTVYYPERRFDNTLIDIDE